MTNPFETIDARLTNIESLILSIKHQSTQETPEKDELLTVQETAKFLHLSVPTIYSLISKSAIPSMKRSKRCYFLKADLIEYLKKGTKKTDAEIVLEATNKLKKRGG
jgi:excisionase family DNA binding protein